MMPEEFFPFRHVLNMLQHFLGQGFVQSVGLQGTEELRTVLREALSCRGARM